MKRESQKLHFHRKEISKLNCFAGMGGSDCLLRELPDGSGIQIMRVDMKSLEYLKQMNVDDIVTRLEKGRNDK
jgi:hypothetical protein